MLEYDLRRTTLLAQVPINTEKPKLTLHRKIISKIREMILMPILLAYQNAQSYRQGKHLIYYFCHYRHRYTIRRWLFKYSVEERGHIIVLPYTTNTRRLQAGTVIFSDVERLTPNLKPIAEKLYIEAEKAKCNILNHPNKSLKRYELQKALNNDFSVYKSGENVNLRFPVFLKEENEHKGSATGLLYSKDELKEALLRYPGYLIIEFLDTSDELGIFRKYSSFYIDGLVIPRHILFSKNWIVRGPDIIDLETVAEELVYINENSYKKEIINIFNIADIQYGRIDYSFYQGRMQVWEINTNPMLTTAETASSKMRKVVHEMSAKLINEAFSQLNSAYPRNPYNTHRLYYDN